MVIINALNYTKMKTELETKAEEFTNALIEKRKGIPDALSELEDEYKTGAKISYLVKLPKLIYHLTKVTKKKSIKDKYELTSKRAIWKKKIVEIGINRNGLGIVDYGLQLSPLANDYDIKQGYSVDDTNLLVLLEIFNDEELCLDIAQEILQSRRKDFLKLASFFRNKELSPSNLSKEMLISGDIVFEFNYRWLLDKIYYKGHVIDYDNTNFIQGKDIDLIKEARIIDFLQINDILEQKPLILTLIQNRKKALILQRDSEAELNNFVNDMITTYEALENL